MRFEHGRRYPRGGSKFRVKPKSRWVIYVSTQSRARRRDPLPPRAAPYPNLIGHHLFTNFPRFHLFPFTTSSCIPLTFPQDLENEKKFLCITVSKRSTFSTRCKKGKRISSTYSRFVNVHLELLPKLDRGRLSRPVVGNVVGDKGGSVYICHAARDAFATIGF